MDLAYLCASHVDNGRHLKLGGAPSINLIEMQLQRRYRCRMSVRKTALVALFALVVSSAVAVCDCFAAADHQHHHGDTHEPAQHLDCDHDECDDCVTKSYNGRAASEFVLPGHKLALTSPERSPIGRFTDFYEPLDDSWRAPPGFALSSPTDLHNASPITRADILIE